MQTDNPQSARPQQPTLTLGKYGAILSDPPWTFITRSSKGKGRSAEAHYPCMPLGDISALPVSGWAADDCILFLWTTHPMLPQALGVMAAWGFQFRTIGFTWVKGRIKADWDGSGDLTPFDRLLFPIGTGYWTRANPELCLLGTRGKPKRQSKSVRELIVSPRREHSRKPDEVYWRIEALCEGPYLEMFARFPREGWENFGSQSGIEPRRWRSNSYPDAGSVCSKSSVPPQ